jgi:hypothetical protein
MARTLTPVDLERLAGFAQTRQEAIAEARGAGDPADVAALDGILSGTEEPILGRDIRGEYRCRVAKLGGPAPIVIYDWFRCEIGQDDIGYQLEKLTGSQRLSGHFFDESATTLVFYGADHYADERPLEYNVDPERNTVGRLMKVGEDRYRLELPSPFRESKFDILELVETD